MKTRYCQGGEDDIISKQDLWLDYSSCCGIADDERSVFFSLLGNSVFKQPAFQLVKRCPPQDESTRGKQSAFKFLKRKHQTADIETSKRNCKEDQSQPSTGIASHVSSLGIVSDILPEPAWPSPDDDVGLMEDQPLLSTDRSINYSFDWEDETSENNGSDDSTNGTTESNTNESQTACGTNEEEFCETLYRKYHRHLDNLLPSCLPGKPTSFQAYLKS